MGDVKLEVDWPYPIEDDDCEGGRRYGEFAPSALAGTCVNADDETTSTSTTSSVPSRSGR